MAAFPPTELPPGDTRPIYSREILPGGPWNRYRPRGWVNAHLIQGPFLTIRAADGFLVERNGPLWVTQDPATLDISILDPDAFSGAWVLDVG